MGTHESLYDQWAWMWDPRHRNQVDMHDTQDPRAYIMNARAELDALRSDIANELSDTPSDCHLKAAFLTYIDAADLNLQKALA